MASEERKLKTRRIRKKLHETVPGCVAVVDHGDWIGAYFYPEDLTEAEKLVAAGEWEGESIQVRLAPPLQSR